MQERIIVKLSTNKMRMLRTRMECRQPRPIWINLMGIQRWQDITRCWLHSSQANITDQNYQATVEQTPRGHPAMPRYLQNLALTFEEQYEQSGDVKDLEAALQYKQASVEQTPEGDPALARHLESLAISFADRYQRSGDLKDLDAA
ncbi:hypothetical protein C8J57DRAFT_1470844, partial [Mycena rebaudengoi]